MKMHKRQMLGVGLAALLASGSLFAQAKKEVTIAHQDMLVPFQALMDTGELEKATGYKINYRLFGGGGDVIKAMASGDVQLGQIGSSPLTAAASQGQDIKLFWILDDIADAEALIARSGSGVNTVKDLKGKKVATPFVSTAHYQLMAVMKMEGLDANSVNVMNMRPPEIAAAWERGDIDAAFIWDPVLSKIKGKGKSIASSGSIGAKGYPTFDGFAVNAKWATEHEAFMVALVQALARADAEALIARSGSGVNTVKDLKGKKVATPFVSTAHYQLMAAMKMEGLDANSVNVMNMRPPEIAAAWERGDIDAAFIWDPVLSKIKGKGKAIASSGSIGAKGYPTFDGFAVNAKWATEHEAFMVALVQALAKADAEYRKDGAKWTANTPQVKAIAKMTKADAAEVPAAMSLYKFPTPAEQLSATWLGGGAAKAMTGTAAFLKEQGRIQEVKPDYAAFVTDAYVKKAGLK